MSKNTHLRHAAFRFVVGASGMGILLYLGCQERWPVEVAPLALFAALSLLVKRSGFHATAHVTHSLVGMIDVSALLIFGPLGGMMVASTSGFTYLLLHALRRRTWSVERVLLHPLFSGGLKSWMAWMAGTVYLLLDGDIPLTHVRWSSLPALAALFAIWFTVDHLGWGLLIRLEGGMAGLRTFLREALPVSLLMELLPLPISILIAALYARGEGTLFSLAVGGVLATSLIIQRFSNVRQSAEKRLRDLSAVSEVSKGVVSILDLDELLRKVVLSVSERFDDVHVHVFLLDQEEEKVVYRAGTDAADALASSLQFALDERGIIPWVARHGEPLLVGDVASDARYRQQPSLGAIRSELAIPLRFGNRVLGVFDLQSETAHAFDEEDLSTFQALGDQIAVAVRNAMLYASEQRKRQAADTLRRVSTALSTTLDTDELLEATLRELNQVVPFEGAALLMVENNVARIAASKGVSAETQALLEGELGTGGDWLASLLESGESIICEPRPVSDTTTSVPQWVGGRCCLGVPLRTGERTRGALLIMRSGEGSFTQDDADLALTFANQVSLALQNAQLFALQEEEAWVSTVLLQVAEMLGQKTSPDEISETIVRTVPLLVGVERCTVFLRNQQSSEFVAQASHAFARGEVSELKGLNLSPTGVPLLERLLDTNSPIVVPDEELEHVLPNDLVHTFQIRHLAAFPMTALGDLLGCLMVEFTDAVWPVGEKALIVVTGIANQTASAIETTRLYTALQEEAWVSTALLQVAEAAGSAVDLTQALEAIVRITPMLVGVDCCAVLLWDEAREQFLPEQQYGLGKETGKRFLQQSFARGDFPLLDELLLRMEPISVQNVLESDLTPGDLAHRLDFSSLVALPLHTKGETLGAMLVGLTDALADFPEKRMAILVGIAGQTAMAIETSRLYGEMAERQRLEQELEVARSIQKSFLPDSCPLLPGWQVSALWRSARQVGGDFYDIILFDDKRVGLVIADVSDKGVPAALYMALSKTLIRAAASEARGPAEALRKANDLLVVDSSSGMFVTVFYGILDVQTGRFTYANAGHNPPVLTDGKGEATLLSADGIILGVMEDIDLEEREITIDHGAVLLMYTDGITDAIDENELEFGLDRLVEVVVQNANDSADDLIRKLDTAVTNHVNQQSQFDDFTLVSVKRLLEGE